MITKYRLSAIVSEVVYELVDATGKQHIANRSGCIVHSTFLDTYYIYKPSFKTFSVLALSTGVEVEGGSCVKAVSVKQIKHEVIRTTLDVEIHNLLFKSEPKIDYYDKSAITIEEIK